MAEDFEDDMGEEDVPPALEEGLEGDDEGGGKKKMLLILLPILVIIGAVVGIYFSGMADSFLGKEDAEFEELDTEEELEGSVFYDLPEMLVNLNTSRRKQVYLKIKVSLELAKKSDVPHVEKFMPRVVDNFQVYLRELRIEELDGSAGIYRLREELFSRVSKAVQPAEVLDVLFKEILVQ